MTDRTYCPYNRIPAVDQALELADEMPPGEERNQLLTSAAEVWMTLTECVVFAGYTGPEPEEETPSGLS